MLRPLQVPYRSRRSVATRHGPCLVMWGWDGIFGTLDPWLISRVPKVASEVTLIPEFFEQNAYPLDGVPLGGVGQYSASVASTGAATAAGRDPREVLQHRLHRQHEL